MSVSPFEEDQRDLRAILSDWPAPIESVHTMEETLRCLSRGPTPLILCERDLPDGNWKLLFQQTEALPRPPRFIVSSRLADDYLWVEVLNLGGQDVLQTPFVAREVRHAVECAWDTWQQLWAPKSVRRPPKRIANSAAMRCPDGATEPWPQLVPGEWPDPVERLIGRKRAY
ncbi:MAG: hypothetical protein LAQ69_30225 [Acidobacteriia bacterium]|nr:hypothetical protein [Terriglobia bacterium]